MKFIYLSVYILLFSILFACQPNTAQEDEGRQQPLGIAEQAKDPRADNNKNAPKIAERLVHLSERVPEVQGATAIVLGDLAVVGIDVNAELDRSDVGVVKYEVAEALKDDPLGAYAFISADPDVNARLKEMQTEIREGHPIAGIMNELAAIVGRLMPIVPGPEHKKAEPEPTDANEERLDEGQDDRLENIQEEQGKRDMDEGKLTEIDDGRERERNEEQLEHDDEQESDTNE